MYNDNKSYVLEDVLRKNQKVVFCGTGSGKESGDRKEYYAGRGNKFWPILNKTGLTDKLLMPADFREVVDYSIGLTDLSKYTKCPDKHIPKTAYDRQELARKIMDPENGQPKYIAFNGVTAAKKYFNVDEIAYGKYDKKIGTTSVYVLPSTSGSASGRWNENYWFDFAGIIKKL